MSLHDHSPNHPNENRHSVSVPPVSYKIATRPSFSTASDEYIASPASTNRPPLQLRPPSELVRTVKASRLVLLAGLENNSKPSG